MGSPIKQPQVALTFAAIGAVFFWLPDLVVHAIYSRTFDTPQVVAITFLMPATLLGGYLVARRFAERFDFKRIDIAMLVGVWLTGGMFMFVGATPSGGGFASGGGFWVPVMVAALSLIPIYTLMAAIYDGSLFALVAVTLVPFLVWCVRSSGILHPFRR